MDIPTVLPGLVVTRYVPSDVATGRSIGELILHGGVARWAPGTARAGQIYKHLMVLPTSYADQTALTMLLSGAQAATAQLLLTSSVTMALSGLNLAVSAVGFAVLAHQLSTMDQRLTAIASDVRAIRTILEIQEVGQLRAALEELKSRVEADDLRRQMLAHAHLRFAEARQVFRGRLENADGVGEAGTFEELFRVALLADTRCMAELGEFAEAQHLIDESVTVWQGAARRIARDLVLGERRVRFLAPEFVETIPVSRLVAWLDFTYDESRGMAWIDELRRELDPYYQLPVAPRDFRRAAASLRDAPQRSARAAKGLIDRRGGEPSDSERLRIDRDDLVPMLDRLTATDEVLSGYVAQYAVMAKHALPPSEFERRLALVKPEDTVCGFVILASDTSEEAA